MNPAGLRADIPALEGITYLNTGAGGPSPRRVVEAVCDCVEHQQYVAPAADGMYPAVFGTLDDTRETVAAFVGARTSEIALTQSTADGISRVATAIPWEAGDTVVRTDLEHSAGILPWSRLRDVSGIDVDVLETERGRIDLDDVKAAVTDATLLCLSSISWNYGTRVAVEDVVEIAHDAGTYVLVDAVQSLGQAAIDVHEWGADFVVGAGHKWLLGPWGAGVLYVRDGVDTDLEPHGIGYASVEEPDAPEYRFRRGARRLEIGTTSPAPYAGLEAAIDIVERVGIDTIEARNEALTDRLKDGLADERLLSPRAYESGLVTISADEPHATVSRLADAGIRVRSLPYPEAVRASIHAFNTEEDIDALLDQL